MKNYQKLIYKWNQSRIKTWYDPNGWLPIKNKKPRASFIDREKALILANAAYKSLSSKKVIKIRQFFKTQG